MTNFIVQLTYSFKKCLSGQVKVKSAIQNFIYNCGFFLFCEFSRIFVIYDAFEFLLFYGLKHVFGYSNNQIHTLLHQLIGVKLLYVVLPIIFSQFIWDFLIPFRKKKYLFAPKKEKKTMAKSYIFFPFFFFVLKLN